MRRALFAVARTAELQAALGGSLKPVNMLARAPALSVVVPSTSRHLWKFGFSSSSSQGQDSKPEAGAQAAAAAEAAAEAGQGQEAQEQPGEEQPPYEELQKSYNELQTQLAEEKKKGEDMKDKLLRTLADMENLRERTARLTTEARQFATQGLVKDIIDVADNLERAAGAVPLDEVNGDKEVDAARALALLRSLRDGVLMTDAILMKIMERQGVVRYDPTGDKFDPNLHNALFEVPDATKEPGTVAVVIKKGYLMHGERAVRAADVGVKGYTQHDRVVRPAEVGVVKAVGAPEGGVADDEGAGA